jgi:hypothetical protein
MKRYENFLFFGPCRSGGRGGLLVDRDRESRGGRESKEGRKEEKRRAEQRREAKPGWL